MPPALPDPEARLARRLDAVRLAIAALLGLLGLVTLARLAEGSLSPAGLLAVALVVAVALALVVHHQITVTLAERRRAREASTMRILQGLSRSLSPDSVVEAIVQELRAQSGADHVLVARVSQSGDGVEVTLVAANPQVPVSHTWLRPNVPELALSGPDESPDAMRQAAAPGDAAKAAQAAAEEIARRVRSAYGLPHTLAQPLVADRRFLGAIILSRRTRGDWAEPERRLLTWAASEVAAAFARAYVLEEAERDANLDALTGLPNRRYFDELVAIVRPRRRTTDSLGILMVDVDRFKALNDRFGHATGDAVLRAVAEAIATTVRAEDTPARYGGEEFAVILRRASAPQASEVGERVRAAVAGLPAHDLGIDGSVTVSVGVAVAGEDEDVAAVIARADQALYRAKRRGRDRVEVG